MKKVLCISAALLALVASACTNKQGESESPVFITTDITLQPGFVNVGTGGPVQVNQITLSSHFKNPTQTDPQGFAIVMIDSYRVHFIRTDGGTVVPADLTFGAGVTVPAGGNTTLTNFPIMTAAISQLSPFDQLLPFNGGIDRETRRDEIDMSFQITFFGHTAAGQRVQSETASGILLFRFSGTTPLSRSKG